MKNERPLDGPRGAAVPSGMDSPVAHAFAANRLFSLLRLGLRTVEKVAPAWAPHLAAQVFCTPVPTKRSTHHLHPPTGVRQQSLPFEKTSLRLYHWPSAEEAPQVLLTHGWGGWGLQMASMAEALRIAGWAPVVLDMPGHGRSGAWSSTLAQFARAVAHVASSLPRVQAVVGHSMGGSATCLAAARGLDVRRLVLIASPMSMEQLTLDYVRIFGLSETTRVGMIRRLEQRENMLMEHLSIRHNAPRIAVPTLVIHDRNDVVVPCSDSLSLSKHLPHARLLTTRGLGHRRVLKDKEVLQAVAAFLAETAK
jgi:pimeloyl-ACP methyl ester carboxylesterase